MPVTTYTVLDLTNLDIISSAFDNCTDLTTPPNAHFSGVQATPSLTLLTTDASKFNEVSGAVIYQYDIDHSTPTDPLPPNALITRVVIQLQGDGEATSDISMTFPAGLSNEGSVLAATTVKVDQIPSPVDTSLGTQNRINSIISDQSLNGNGLITATASNDPAGAVVGWTFDFTTNPGGLFPSGYMTYSEFIANFAQIVLLYTLTASYTAQWAHTGGATSDATGSASVGGELIANNWQMEVTWSLPSNWTITSDNPADVPYILTLERPDPNVPPSEDTELPTTLWIDDKKITPDDPWVIIWIKVQISIHIPPNLIKSSTPVYLEFNSTEFEGKVPIGTLGINIADLSGIYQFDIDQHSDELYSRTTTSTTVTTQTVAIPAPFLVTAFINDPETDILHYIGTRMRVTGQGVLHQVFQSLDVIKTQNLPDITLVTANNVSPFTLANFVEQNASLRVMMSATDDYMNVSKIIIFSKELYTGYPQ